MFIDGFDPPAPRHRSARDGRVARVARRGHRRRGQGPRPLPARPAHGAGPRARASACPRWSRPTTSTRSRPSRSRGSRATSTSSAASARSSAGTRWRWSTARTTASTASAVTSRRTRRRPRSTRSASTTSSAARATAASATRSSSRATPRPASTPARSSKAGSPRSSSTTSGARSTAAGCRRTRTRGACRRSGSSRRCRWGSARSTRSYQARFNRYLYNRELVDTSQGAGVVLRRRRRDGRARGDGRRCRLAAREQLDNLIFVVNCNLQRLDGPVRGNGKVIQELESTFRGAGWNVIKVDLGPRVGRAARPRRRRRARQQDEHAPSTASSRSTRSSRARTSASTSSAPTRGCARWSSTSPTTSCSKLPRGGHDYRKLYAAYKTAVEHEGSADRDPRQDGEGLDARRRLRGAQRDAPDQEDDAPTS